MSRYAKRKTTEDLPAFNPLLRYPIKVASAFLSQGEGKTFADIKAGRIIPIREGRRTFIPGSEIVRLCSPPPLRSPNPNVI